MLQFTGTVFVLVHPHTNPQPSPTSHHQGSDLIWSAIIDIDHGHHEKCLINLKSRCVISLDSEPTVTVTQPSSSFRVKARDRDQSEFTWTYFSLQAQRPWLIRNTSVISSSSNFIIEFKNFIVLLDYTHRIWLFYANVQISSGDKNKSL